MITACCKAYAATGEAVYLKLAENNIIFLEKNFRDAEANWHHTWKAGQAKHPAFLDDYAYLIQAYIRLQEVTGNGAYLLSAKKMVDKVVANFADNETSFFWYTGSTQTDIIIRKKEVYDGAVPSGNAVMTENLLYLSVVFNIPEWKIQALTMLESLSMAIVRHPTSFGIWGLLLQSTVNGINEIAITGIEASKLLKEVNKQYIPNKIIQSAALGSNNFPLLEGKFANLNNNFIYLCRDYNCQKPVPTAEDLIMLLKN